MWLYRCASVVQVAAFEAQDQKTLPHLKDSSKFVADIGAALEGNAVPSKFRVDYWRILCDFAHTGPMQAKRRLGFEGESRGYVAEEVIFVLRKAGFLGSSRCLRWHRLPVTKIFAVASPPEPRTTCPNAKRYKET